MSKQKIFNATVELMSEKGPSVSVREIARKADVNVAAINYHFGSKDNLICEVIVFKLEQFKFAFDQLADSGVKPIERLKQFLFSIVDLIGENPELSYYIIDQKQLFKTRYEYQVYLKTIGYHKLETLIMEITQEDDPQIVTINIEHVLAASIMTYLTQLNIVQQNEHYIIDENYKQAIDIFVDNYFYRYQNQGGK